MRILMLGNSFTYCNDLDKMLSALTGAEVVRNVRGGARLSEQLNPATELGANTFQFFTRNPRGGSVKKFDEADQKLRNLIGTH